MFTAILKILRFLYLAPMSQTVLPSQMFFFLLMLLSPLLHNSWLASTCLAKKAQFDITTDASALLAMRDHFTTSSDLKDWTANISTSTASVCSWVGVTCGSRHQRVVALDLADMGLTGTVPSHIGNLSFLVYLDISNNKFHGQLPGEMAHLRRLSKLNVSFNSFSGNIPSWFGFLLQLKYLDIQNNSFTGPIPPSLSNCSKLEFLNIMSNQVSGMIPQEIGYLNNLKHVRMAWNQLSGQLSSSIFNISMLETFSLTGNGISGNLPGDMCSSLPKLSFLGVSYNKLEGRIPAGLQFCSQLERLSLSYNKFHGPVPIAFRNLTLLKLLYLGGNNLEGGIPSELANLVNLKKLGLESAGLGGSIPPSIFRNITFLEAVVLSRNSLTGRIPVEIGNCTSMYVIDLGYNNLTGQVLESLGSLHKLEYLSLQMNNFGGHVPFTIFNLTSLTVLALVGNHLVGHLPPTIGFGLPNLEELYLGGNQFIGTIPDSISNASKLARFDISNNNFTGSPPSTFGNLRFLNWLGLQGNNLSLEGETIFTSLNNCRQLSVLYISFNQLNGPLPTSFGNLTSSLHQFEAEGCRITGKIPQEFGNMSNLHVLDLISNHLVGSLPNMLEGWSSLQQFGASGNNLSGSVPDDICRLLRLGWLDVGGNKLSGPLPGCLGNITTLRYLYLKDNELSHKVPASLWTLADIIDLDLSSNSFTGYLPPDVGMLRAATYINLSMNQMSGEIPSAIGSLLTLASLLLAHNKFNGSIPESLGTLVSLETLDLSHNNLSGEIPRSLEHLSHLKILNLSFNHLSGEIPTEGPFKNLSYLSFESNKELCGSSRFHVPPCRSDISPTHLRKRRKVLLFVYVFMGMVLLVLAVLATLYVILKCRKKHEIPLVEDLQTAVTPRRISYHEILQATNSFDDSNLLGKGSFGAVYKGLFTNGRVWAVKVFSLQMPCALRSFDTECEILRNVRHRNLTKVITSCTNLDFLALVLEYMPNGSLDRWLYSYNHLLDVKQRLDLMIDVASALEYLHHGYSVPIVHCDLKPSNILLDEDFIGHVSDFGIAKFLKEGSVVQTNTLATIGYTSPEYGQEGLVSTKCDVYSFGIILMEVFTRRRPTDRMFNGDLDLKLWVKQSLPHSVMEVIDGNLVKQDGSKGRAIVQCVSIIFELASSCSADSPDERMNMKDVLAVLKKTKLQFLANVT